VFTARYELSPYIKQTRFVFKGLKEKAEEKGVPRDVNSFCVLHASLVSLFDNFSGKR
jgi:hypothetical protein